MWNPLMLELYTRRRCQALLLGCSRMLLYSSPMYVEFLYYFMPHAQWREDFCFTRGYSIATFTTFIVTNDIKFVLSKKCQWIKGSRCYVNRVLMLPFRHCVLFQMPGFSSRVWKPPGRNDSISLSTQQSPSSTIKRPEPILYHVLPFGLFHVPSAFHRLIWKVFRVFIWVWTPDVTGFLDSHAENDTAFGSDVDW